MPRKAKPAISPVVESRTAPAEAAVEAAPPVRAPRKRAAAAKKQPVTVSATPIPKAEAKPARKKQALPAKPRKTTHELDADLLEAIARAMPGSDREFEKMRRAHAAGADLGKLLSADDFARALTIWLKNMKYQIGLDPKDFKAENEVKWAKHLVSLGAQLLGSGMPMFVSGGATSEETFPVLLPFLPLADLVAFQVKFGVPMLLPIIFADGLKPEILRQRFQQFMELGKPLPQFGMKLNGNSTSPATIYPLLVFFNETCYQTAVTELLPGAHLRKIWDALNLYVGFVNVPGKQVTWPEMNGLLAGFGSWLTKAFGQKLYPFETVDLLNVLQVIKSF
jgi:hypothetical protein